METLNSLQCEHCAHLVKVENKFCPGCGSPQIQQEISADKKWSNIQGIALFFALEVIVCLSAIVIEKPGLLTDLVFHSVTAISALSFFISDWSHNKNLLKWPGFTFKKLIGFIALTVLGSLMVQFLVELINLRLFHESQNYRSYYFFSSNGKYLMVFFIAFCPALFEELAYRGYVMTKLLSVFDRKEAIYISSSLFFLIHFSFLSFFWLLPFALILAYLRVKENTLWYGITIHFTFNLTACLLELFPL